MINPVRAFVYCIEFDGGHVAKVGSTGNPRGRLEGVSSTAPFKMKFRHCLEVSSREVASAWEKIILANAERYRARGEWVSLTPHLDDLFSEVCDAVCVLDEVSQSPTEYGRRIDAHSDHFAALAKAEVKAKFGATHKAPTGDFQRDTIWARLSEGFGAEDCHLLDGIPLEAFRAEVKSLREAGRLHEIMRLPVPSVRASA